MRIVWGLRTVTKHHKNHWNLAKPRNYCHLSGKPRNLTLLMGNLFGKSFAFYSSQTMSTIQLPEPYSGPYTTADGHIDMVRYEQMWNQPENIKGINLDTKIKIGDLLAKIKAQVSDKPGLIQREFHPIDQINGHAANHDATTDNATSDEATTDTATTNGTSDRSPDLIRIMQWNILADALSLGTDNFVRCPVEALDWSSRRLRLLEEILTRNPDVLTLQEVDHYGFFKHALGSVGYEGFFYPKPDSPTLYIPDNNGPDGVAIFIKTSVLEIINVDKIVLKNILSQVNTNQVCVIIELKVKNSGKAFTIASTHLKAKAGWDRVRHAQGAYLAWYLEKNYSIRPLLVTGDFNADHNELVYKVFSESKLGLASVYKQATGSGVEPPYTTWKIRGSSEGVERESKRTIDFIWCSKDRVRMVNTLGLPTPHQIGPNRLPSYIYPSDHLALAADFYIE